MLPRMKFASMFLLLAIMLSFFPAGVAAAAVCDQVELNADVTVPDGTNFAAGATFVKTWRLKNIGTCTWATTYSLVFDTGEKMGGPASVNLTAAVAPGATADLSVNLTAPSTAGTYQGFWKLKNASGVLFGIGTTADKSFWVKIVVPGAVTGGYDFVANAASATWTSGAGALTFPGTDGDAKGFGLKLDNPTFENNLTYGNGLLFAPNNTTNGFIQAVYPAYTVQSGDHFLARIGCQSGATTCYVEYRLQYQIGTGAVTTFSRPKFPFPFREKNEGLTYPVNVDLSSLAGQSVKFILWVSAVTGVGSPAGNRALWGSPRITSGGVVPPPPPASCTDRALYKADISVPDGTSFALNAAFTKTWQFKNIGTCTWTTAYQLIFDSGDKMGGPDSAALPISVAPGNTVNISINLTAPAAAGAYKGNWKFKNNNGVVFALCPFGNCFLGNQKAFWVDIKVAGTLSPLTLTITASPTVYDHVDQEITYSYVIKNTGATTLPSTQFTVSDNHIGAPLGTAFNCGAATSLVAGASATCNAPTTYKITAADMTVASVTNTATASGVGGASSAATSFTINKAVKALTLTPTANPTTYNLAGQTITFTYVIKNTGNIPMLPDQFTVLDTLISPTAFNCGAANTPLPLGATVSCTATYTITAGNMTAASVSNFAKASGGGVESSVAAATVNKTP